MTYDKANGRRSIRLANWDYRQRGAYFVTICTYERTLLVNEARWREIVEDVWPVVCAPTTPRRG